MFSAFLNQHGDNNFRIAAWRISNKPGVVFEFFLFPHSVTRVVTNDLCGAGLAAQLNPGEPQLAAGAATFVDNTVHSVGYFLHGGFGNGEALFSHTGRVHSEVRLLKHATHSDSANHTGQLQRRSRNCPLTGGHRNRLARVPFPVKHALDPFLRRHKPGLFRGEIDSSLVPEAEFAAVIRKPVNAQAHPYIVEKHVAGLEDGLVQIGDPVRCCSGLRVVDPALELAAVERPVAWTKCGETFRWILVLQHRCRSDDLENRPWRKLRLNGFVQQCLVSISN